MQATGPKRAKPRRSRGKSLAATLGIAAALTGIAVPAALPTAASALPRNEWCTIVFTGYEGALRRGEWSAANWWYAQYEAARCMG